MTLNWKWLVCSFSRHYNNKQANLITTFPRVASHFFPKVNKQIMGPYIPALRGVLNQSGAALTARVCEFESLKGSKETSITLTHFGFLTVSTYMDMDGAAALKTKKRDK